jgi:hypothetical protein
LRFLDARIGIKEPDVGRLIAATTLPALTEAGIDRAADFIGTELRKVAAAAKPLTVRTFVKDVAKAAGASPTDLWKKVAEDEPKLAGTGVRVTPAAAQRVTTMIRLSDGVHVSGLSTALDGRYRVATDPNSDGWILEILTSEYPIISHTARRGPIRT